MTSPTGVEHWLKLGLGRAFLALRENPLLVPQEIILEACLHNQALDRQLEGTRADYMYAILELYKNDSHRGPYFRNALLQCLGLLNELSVDYDVEQVYLLVNRYADDGDQEARALLYRHFDQFPTFAGSIGALVLTALDGLAGFVYAVERLGKLNSADMVSDRDYLCSILLQELEDHLGVETAQREFDLSWATNEKVAYFFRPTQKNNAPGKSFKKLAYPQSLQQKLRAGERIPIAAYEWAKTASSADLEAAAEDLVNRTTPPLFLLKVFGVADFPREPEFLFPFSYDPNIPIRAAGFGALRRMTQPSVHAFALDCIASDHQIGWSVGLLENCFESSDWLLLERLASRELEPDDYHSLAFRVLDIYDAYTSMDGAAALFQLYEKVCCSLCRRRVVENLHALGVLPPSMKEECLYDSDEAIRRWARELQ
ncbi:MAG: hypothetical protein U0670_21140 [Anaerolineae bacterium]